MPACVICLFICSSVYSFSCNPFVFVCLFVLFCLFVCLVCFLFVCVVSLFVCLFCLLCLFNVCLFVLFVFVLGHLLIVSLFVIVGVLWFGLFPATPFCSMFVD